MRPGTPAARGTDLDTFTARLDAVDPDQVGKALATLATDPSRTDPAYLITPTGLEPAA